MGSTTQLAKTKSESHNRIGSRSNVRSTTDASEEIKATSSAEMALHSSITEQIQAMDERASPTKLLAVISQSIHKIETERSDENILRSREASLTKPRESRTSSREEMQKTSLERLPANQPTHEKIEGVDDTASVSQMPKIKTTESLHNLGPQSQSTTNARNKQMQKTSSVRLQAKLSEAEETEIETAKELEPKLDKMASKTKMRKVKSETQHTSHATLIDSARVSSKSPSNQLIAGILKKSSSHVATPASPSFHRKGSSMAQMLAARIIKSQTPIGSKNNTAHVPNPLNIDEETLKNSASSPKIMAAILKQSLTALPHRRLSPTTTESPPISETSTHLLEKMHSSGTKLLGTSSSIMSFTQIPTAISSGEQIAKSILSDILETVESDSPTKEGPKILFFEEYKEGASPEASLNSSEEELEDAVERECVPFAGVETFATTVVRKIIGESVDNVKRMGSEVNLPEEKGGELVVIWPSIEDFDVDLGMSTIYAFIGTWPFDEDWAYCIEFLVAQSDECSDFYLYEAKFSIPTNPYPVPQVNANVYFTIEVSRVKPAVCGVVPTYVFETNRLVHTVNEKLVWEDCLFRIIDAKLKFYSSVNF